MPRAGPNVDAVVAALHAAGGRDSVAYVLARLQARRPGLAAALGGETLQVRLAAVGRGGGERDHLIVFSPDGGAGRLRPDGALAARFRPHLTVRGTPPEVVGLVLGTVDVARAVYRGLLVLHVPPADLAPRYARVLRVVATELLLLADAARPPCRP